MMMIKGSLWMSTSTVKHLWSTHFLSKTGLKVTSWGFVREFLILKMGPNENTLCSDIPRNVFSGAWQEIGRKSET